MSRLAAVNLMALSPGSVFADIPNIEYEKVKRSVTLSRVVPLVSPSLCLLVHPGRSYYRPWGALLRSLRSTIVSSVPGGAIMSVS